MTPKPGGVALSHRKPCAECPFSRANDVERTGGSDVLVYVGQSMGPFLLACHMDQEYDKNARNPELLQCAGAAAFRANIGRDKLMPPQLLRCASDTELVFANHAEMVAHYRQISVAEAEELLKQQTPEELMKIEFRKAGVREVDKSRIKTR